MSDDDLAHLRRCTDLARVALRGGDEPFASRLVDPDGVALFEDHNRVKSGLEHGDATRHPEFAIARWAAQNLSPERRAGCTVYTSGEHCSMCAAARAWVGLGRIVYAASSAQLIRWLRHWGAKLPPVAALPITTVAPGIVVDGPAPELAEEIKALYAEAFAG